MRYRALSDEASVDKKKSNEASRKLSDCSQIFILFLGSLTSSHG
jgi:hypothetical protein